MLTQELGNIASSTPWPDFSSSVAGELALDLLVLTSALLRPGQVAQALADHGVLHAVATFVSLAGEAVVQVQPDQTCAGLARCTGCPRLQQPLLCIPQPHSVPYSWLLETCMNGDDGLH